MSYPSAAPRFHQIDVVDQVGRAYRIVFDNLQLVGELALLPYLIVLGIELVAVLIPGAGFYGRMLAGLIHAVAFLIFGSVFIVRWHSCLATVVRATYESAKLYLCVGWPRMAAPGPRSRIVNTGPARN